MHHGWLEWNAGFPPEIHVHGGPLSGGRFPSLQALIAAAVACDRGRETYRLWSRQLETAYFMAKAEGICPPLSILPGHGVTGIDPCRGVQFRAARPMLADSTLEAMADQDLMAAEGWAILKRSMDATEAWTGEPCNGSIGAATTQALFGGHWMPRWTSWPEDAPPEMAQLCYDAYHGGLQAVWHAGAVLAPGGRPMDELWIDESPVRLDEGWTLAELDRDSAYAEDAAEYLPDCLSPVVTDPALLLDLAGGAIIDCIIDLDGFRGVGFPIRYEVAPGVTRSAPATRGAFRGVWCSDILRWAIDRGARVQVCGGIGWKRAARFLAPLMDRLWELKNAAEPGSVERDTYKATIQRAVGRLGRRHYTTVTLCGAEAMDEAAHPERWPLRWERVHGYGGGYFVADAWEKPEGLPRGVVPPWPAFVVSRAWMRLADRIEQETARGAWPIYCDTDGAVMAYPPGAEPEPEPSAMGAYRIKRRYLAVEHREKRQFSRVDDTGAEHIQFAGVPRKAQRNVLAGKPWEHETESALIDLQAIFRQVANQLAPVLDATKERVARAKRVGRHATLRENEHG